LAVSAGLNEQFLIESTVSTLLIAFVKQRCAWVTQDHLYPLDPARFIRHQLGGSFAESLESEFVLRIVLDGAVQPIQKGGYGQNLGTILDEVFID
jgi:hypothetical protein